jgi:hypothetical protein
MDLETFNWLLTDDGQALLAAAMGGNLSEDARLRELSRLRRQATPERVAAAYEIARLRERAAAKFARAAELYFTREALEQASGEAIAAYRAARYRPYATVADLACGAGGDALTLAQISIVTAVDRDPLRLAMAAANARARGLADRITFVQADLQTSPPPAADAIFFDPARRSEGRRVFALDAYQPPVSLVDVWRERIAAIGVKVAPGVSDDELAALDGRGAGQGLEVEFISVDGELKEAALWFGPLAGPRRRATVLSTNGQRPTANDQRPTTNDQRPTTNDQRPGTFESPAHPTPDTQHPTPDTRHPIPDKARAFSMHSSLPSEQPPLTPPAAYLYEPDPAVIRAHLVAGLATQLGVAQLDPTIAYLTAERAIATPFARCWRVVEWLPFGLKRLRARLRALDAGAVTVKKRGSPLDTDALARQLSGGGARPLVVVLTRAMARPAALICEGPIQEMTR